MNTWLVVSEHHEGEGETWKTYNRVEPVFVEVIKQTLDTMKDFDDYSNSCIKFDLVNMHTLDVKVLSDKSKTGYMEYESMNDNTMSVINFVNFIVKIKDKLKPIEKIEEKFYKSGGSLNSIS